MGELLLWELQDTFEMGKLKALTYKEADFGYYKVDIYEGDKYVFQYRWTALEVAIARVGFFKWYYYDKCEE